MISRASAILKHSTNDMALNAKRAQVLINLCRSKMTIEDIAQALNCSGSVVRMLLASAFRSYIDNDSAGVMKPISLKLVSTNDNNAHQAPSLSEPMIPTEHDSAARHLATEVCQWLNAFEASDTIRREEIERAWYFLDQSVRYSMDGRYHFDADHVAWEIGSNWRPCVQCPVGQDFEIGIGRWLAGWIHFWVAEPAVWNRALELELARFDELVKAAA